MTRPRRGLLALFVVATIGCASHRANVVPAGAGPLVGVYRAAIDLGDGQKRAAKLSIWAERPDRLHVELVAPLGGVTSMLDAGGGVICVVDSGASTAYVGTDGPDAIGALVGVHVSVAEAVAALLDGAAARGLEVTRDAGTGGTLPAKIRIADGARSIELSRIRFERGTTDPGSLGTGSPPKRLTVRPLEDFVRAGE